MNATERFFVDCIKVGIDGNCITSVPDGIEYKYLYKLCATHSVSVIVFRALEHVRADLLPQFDRSLEALAHRHVIRDIQSKHDINTVVSALEKNGIRHMPLKGYHIKELYPTTDMRYASDCDILVDADKLDRVDAILKDLGLEQESSTEHHDVYYFPSTKSVFEMHKTLFVGYLESYFGTGFERSHLREGTQYFYEMTPEDFYISILAHSAYHFAESAGVGIRHLTDIYLYRKAYALNYSYIDEQLEQCGLLSFKNRFESLADYFFLGKDVDEFVEKLAGHVLESSVLANEERISASEVADNLDGNLKKAKKQALAKTLFPKKEYMVIAYPIIKKAGWLLPVFYPIRWIEVLLTRPKNIRKIGEISSSDSADTLYLKEIRTGLGIEHINI